MRKGGIIVNGNRRTEKTGRPGNEATEDPSEAISGVYEYQKHCGAVPVQTK